jgi:uncharacterized protein (DUF952 family)
VALIYKIVERPTWDRALAVGVFEGSGPDRSDGFIHFSTAEQAQETARRHFAGRDDLLVVAVEADGLGQDLRWEPSRGGALFPHLYGALSCEAVVWARPAPLDVSGIPVLGRLTP